MPASAFPDPEYAERYRAASETFIPWIESVKPLDGSSVLEYGCGKGAVSWAFAERVGQHIGFDIDAKVLAEARAITGRTGLSNLELRHSPPDRILADVAAAGPFDVFLLYAVLEHMTVRERLAVLRLARETVTPEGLIVVCELPNRLIPVDHHTSFLPFFTQLPEELALAYFDRSPREDFVDGIRAGVAAGEAGGLEALIRWGRGVSFHEFELVFEDLSRHVLASNYDPRLLADRPVTPDEIDLARLLHERRPDLAPVWSRYWQDVILSPRPDPTPRRFIRPWIPETGHSPGVAWTRDRSLELLEGARLRVSLPAPTQRVVVGASVATETFTLSEAFSGASAEVGPVAAAHPYTARYATLELDRSRESLELLVSERALVTFVGYEESTG